jgi:hypothetical protein
MLRPQMTRPALAGHSLDSHCALITTWPQARKRWVQADYAEKSSRKTFVLKTYLRHLRDLWILFPVLFYSFISSQSVPPPAP